MKILMDYRLKNSSAKLDPLLKGLKERLYNDTFTADVPVGHLSQEWADKLGIPASVVVGAGTFDAHAGAVGGEIEAYTLSKVMGTSTCDMLVAPSDEAGDKLGKRDLWAGGWFNCSGYAGAGGWSVCFWRYLCLV
jgi:sugar (pentulose or hexulose) kinase